MITEIETPELDGATQEELFQHLRLSTGFDGAEEPQARAAFRAAVSHLEVTTGLCLLPRRIAWRTAADGDLRLRAPVRPLRSLLGAQRISADGAREDLDISAFHIAPVAQSDEIIAALSLRGYLEFTLLAGFGAGWADTPADLRRAVYLLAADYFDQRHASGAEQMRPVLHGVADLIRPWRRLRLRARGLA